MTKQKPKKGTKHPVLQIAIAKAQKIYRYKLLNSLLELIKSGVIPILDFAIA
ncbi:hypothetical protein [Nostoc sp. WHI]|uniref:hypothetical protein n=1 Tax=Nostoc sp. WHI TaxID=2650611 RepID=UPI0018C848FD|nr:hypothetical protein [Nostoc sp. WHI]